MIATAPTTERLPEWALAKIREQTTCPPDPYGLGDPRELRAHYSLHDFDGGEIRRIPCIASRSGEFLRDVEPKPANTSSFLDDVPNRPKSWRSPRKGKGKAPRYIPIGGAVVKSHSLYWTGPDGMTRKLGLWPIDSDIVDRALQALPIDTIVECVRGVRQSMGRIVRKRYKVSARVGIGKFGQVFMGVADDCFQSALTNILHNKIPGFDREKMRAVARDTARQVIRNATAAGKCPMPYVNIRTKRIDEESVQMIGGVEVVTRQSVEVEVSKHRAKGYYKPKAMTTSAGDTLGEFVPASGLEERERVKRMLEKLTDKERDIIMTLYRSTHSATVERFGGGTVYNLLGKCRKMLIGR
jgi:hypothetical protein